MLLGANNITLNTNATSLTTITATGSQNLTVGGTALNIANLHTFDGSAATGKLDVTFNGTGNVAATGGSADDIFRFKSPGFTSASSVNGGGGNNILATEINTGAILATGVGPNITNVEVIQHITDPAATGAFTADMALSGSATKLDLAGNYANQNVSVSNLTDADSVVYTGPAAGAIGNIGTLTLAHEAPGGGQHQLHDGRGPGRGQPPGRHPDCRAGSHPKSRRAWATPLTTSSITSRRRHQ